MEVKIKPNRIIEFCTDSIELSYPIKANDGTNQYYLSHGGEIKYRRLIMESELEELLAVLKVWDKERKGGDKDNAKNQFPNL